MPPINLDNQIKNIKSELENDFEKMKQKNKYKRISINDNNILNNELLNRININSQIYSTKMNYKSLLDKEFNEVFTKYRNLQKDSLRNSVLLGIIVGSSTILGLSDLSTLGLNLETLYNVMPTYFTTIVCFMGYFRYRTISKLQKRIGQFNEYTNVDKHIDKELIYPEVSVIVQDEFSKLIEEKSEKFDNYINRVNDDISSRGKTLTSFSRKELTNSFNKYKNSSNHIHEQASNNIIKYFNDSIQSIYKYKDEKQQELRTKLKELIDSEFTKVFENIEKIKDIIK